ncbi:hypothetical protein E1B28_003036 [Marasmius oreades]|uniref:Uncharacterized protein n=1 Tax=Marasmius oreades TaxID=181124 RepID=A0A9P7UK70_9AGAR|nr:uncharacterized protein E1B28_003036 [Marasmius oreades]KAG7085475.1 hypothetical protein E1B28_003036 [Marasmius oreades]
MVHRSSDTRLLNNLISHEKDYSKHLSALLDSSHASCNSLTVFAASSPPPTSQLILAIAGSLHSVDDALRGYVAAVERWRQHLADLKDLEDEVGNIIRDREILVTRLLKASTRSKPPSNNNRDSIMSFSHQSSSTLDDPTSMSYLPGSPESTFSTPNKKLQAAQAELQACEAHLAIKERELDHKRSVAVQEGLQARFRALAECGGRWAQIGKDVTVRLLGGQLPNITPDSASPAPQFISSPESKPLPFPMPDLPVIHTPTPIRPLPPTASPLSQSPAPESEISHTSSIAPSQSASQVGTITQTVSSPVHIYSNLEAVDASEGGTVSPAAVPPSPLKRHTLPHRITEEDLRPETSSDDEGGQEPVRVVENPRYRGGGLSASSREVPSSLKKDKGGGIFGSIRGLFHRHPREGSAGSSVGRDEDQDSESGSVGRGRGRRKPLFGVGGKKTTNTNTSWWGDKIDSGSPGRPARPVRRVSEDIIVPPSSTFSTPVRGRVMSMSDVSPVNGSVNVNGKKLKKKGGGSEGPLPIVEESKSREKKKKAKRRRSASLDPGALREDNDDGENIVDLGGRRRDRQDSLVRAEEWVDSQKRQEPQAPAKKASTKKKKQTTAGIGTRLGGKASSSTPVLPSSWAAVHDDVSIVPVEGAGGGLSRSSSTRSRAQSTTTTVTPSSSPKYQSSNSTEHIRILSTVPQPATTSTATKAQRRSSSPVTFSNGSASLMSIVEDVAKANREAWSAGSGLGNTSGLAKSVGGTVKPASLIEVKAPRKLSAKDLEGVVDISCVSKEKVANGSASASLFLPKAPSMAKEDGSVRSLPVTSTATSAAAAHQQQQPARSSSVSRAERKPVAPLRSALKSPTGSNSRAPSPMPPPATAVIPAQPEASTPRIPSGQMIDSNINGKINNEDGDSDVDSISSYETGREVPVPVGAPFTPTLSPPPAQVYSSSRLSPPPPPLPQKQNGLTVSSDISASSGSTIHQGEDGGGEKPRRRKSVRVSLKPQFSPTPPAVDDDPEGLSWYDESTTTRKNSEDQDTPTHERHPDLKQGPSRNQGRKGRNGDYERDMWQDSSEEEEDGDYASARRLLMKGLSRGRKDSKS